MEAKNIASKFKALYAKCILKKIIELNILCWTWVSSCSSITSNIV